MKGVVKLIQGKRDMENKEINFRDEPIRYTTDSEVIRGSIKRVGNIARKYSQASKEVVIATGVAGGVIISGNIGPVHDAFYDPDENIQTDSPTKTTKIPTLNQPPIATDSGQVTWEHKFSDGDTWEDGFDDEDTWISGLTVRR